VYDFSKQKKKKKNVVNLTDACCFEEASVVIVLRIKIRGFVIFVRCTKPLETILNVRSAITSLHYVVYAIKEVQLEIAGVHARNVQI